jgi:thiol-disulfide isomerase/thioredoxin
MVTTRFKALRTGFRSALCNLLVVVLALFLATRLAAPLHAAWQSAVTGHMLGKRMPPLALTTAVPASPRTDAAAAGGVVLLDFWAPWCAPCQERVPLLNALQADYRTQGLTVIGLERASPLEGEDVLERAAVGVDARQRVPFAYAVGPDPGGGLFARMGVRSLPYAVLVDRNGIVVWQGDPSRLSRATIEATLRAPRVGTLARF